MLQSLKGKKCNCNVHLQIAELYKSISANYGISFRIEVTGFKKGSVIVEFVVFLESFEKARTNLEVQDLFSQQKSGQNEQTMLGEFTLDSKFTKFSGMYTAMAVRNGTLTK